MVTVAPPPDDLARARDGDCNPYALSSPVKNGDLIAI